MLEADHQSAVDHLNLVLNALRYQEKFPVIMKTTTFTGKLEEQKMAVEEANEQQEASQAQLDQVELEADQLRNQLAD